MTISYEYRKEIHRNGEEPVLLVNSFIPDPTVWRYRSVYGYPLEVTGRIIGNGNTKDLKGCPVYSNVLYIDVDIEENIRTVKTLLGNTPYNEYSTGNRGRHFHIPIEPMKGIDVIYSQIQWLKSKGLWDYIDHSIYREGGQIRRAGSYHEKTNRMKIKLGQDYFLPSIKIPMLVPPPVTTPQVAVVDGSEDAKQIFFMNLMRRRSVGGRHQHMFILWRSGINAGFDESTVSEAIRNWNNSQKVPHEPEEVEKKLRSFICSNT